VSQVQQNHAAQRLVSEFTGAVVELIRIQNEHTVSLASGIAQERLEAETVRLASLIYAHSPHDGVFSQRIPGLHVSRFSRMNMQTLKTVYQPSLLIVAQGAKAVTVGHELYPLGKYRILMFPVALPVAMQTTETSYEEPFLGFRLDLDPKRIAELVLKVYPQGLPLVHQWSPGYVTDADSETMSAAARLMECLHSPADVEMLAPLVIDEILIRLLRSPIGVHAAEMGIADSAVQRVAKAIAWLQDNFSQSMQVADLAKLVHMSVSSFRVQFKQVTSMSPLQYQKALRLQEARRLMLTGDMDAATACRLAGYVSASQFSRDYSRFFGSPPSKDMARLRQ